MADENQNQDNGGTGDNTPASDPFAGFKSEAYHDGQPVEPEQSGSDDGQQDDKGGQEGTGNQTVPHIGDEDDDPLAAFTDQEDDDDSALQSEPAGSGDEFDGAGDDDDPDDADVDGDPEDPIERRAHELASRMAQKRIAELTKKRREAERKVQEYEAQLSQQGQSQEPPKEEPKGEDKGAEKADAPLTDAEGNALEKPDPQKYTYGEVDPDYINDVVNYNVEARLSKERQANEQRQAQAAEQQKAQELRQRWNDISEDGAQKYQDFETVVLEPAKRGEFPLTKEMAEDIGESDVATDIVYHLARNPKEAQKVAGMEPRARARYIGRLEAAIQTRDKQRDKGERRMTKASPPPRRQPRGAGGQFVSKAASTDFSAFEKQAMAQQDRKR
jgi:sulfur relay (sulfurtransferase) DsrC/TusE family protein